MATILIIDDDPQIIKLLKTFLEFTGHTIITAANGKAGLRVLSENSIDLMITDIIMPEKDGIEVLTAIKGMPNRPRVIAMSGGSPNLDQDHLLKMATIMKADRVLAKPLQLSSLSEIVKELLETP